MAKAPNKRLQMVKGSVWRFTQDANLTYRGRNPAYMETIQKFWNEESPKLDKQGVSRHDQIKLRDQYLKDHGIEEWIDMPLIQAEAGKDMRTRY